MSELEQERPTIQRMLQLNFPNETSEDQIMQTAREIAGHLFMDPVVGEPTFMGTIVLFDVKASGIRDMKRREDLVDEELRIRNLTLEHFESME